MECLLFRIKFKKGMFLHLSTTPLHLAENNVKIMYVFSPYSSHLCHVLPCELCLT